MKIPFLRHHDADGPRCVFFATKREARQFVRQLEERQGDPSSGAPLGPGRQLVVKIEEIPPGKAGLVRWLNANVENVDGF